MKFVKTLGSLLPNIMSLLPHKTQRPIPFISNQTRVKRKLMFLFRLIENIKKIKKKIGGFLSNILTKSNQTRFYLNFF